MKIVALNLSGMTKYENQQKRQDWAREQAADAFVFGEWRPEKATNSWRAWANINGYNFSKFIRRPSKSVRSWRGGIAVISRMAVNFEDISPTLEQFQAYMSAADAQHGVALRCDFGLWEMIAVYFPGIFGDSDGIWKKQPYIDLLRRRFPLTEKPSLIIGDFNVGSNLLDKTEKGSPLLPKGWYDEMVGPKAISGEHKGLSLIDLWRRTNGDAREYTWASRRNGEIVNEFRLDHALGNSGFVNMFDPICYYDHQTRPLLSDHSGIIVEMK
jgi:exonuclease III